VCGFGGWASAADRRVEQFVTLFADASGEGRRGLRVSGSVVDDDSAQWQAGEKSAVIEDLAHVGVVGQAQPDDVAGAAEVRHGLVRRVGDVREDGQRSWVSCPDVQRPSGFCDRSGHGRALVPQADEANAHLY
jgi:hypothetical protein